MTVAPTPLPGRRVPLRYQIAAIGALLVAVVGGTLLVQHDVFSGSSGTGTRGSGVEVTQARHVGGFAGIELAGSNVVTVHVGGPQSVVVSADSNLLNRVTTRVANDTLVIGNRGSFSTVAPMSVDVNLPALTALTLSGSGVIVADGLRAPAVTLRLTGSGVVRATGAVTRLRIVLDGSGDAQLEGLVAHDVQATVNGSGRILVTATDTLDASVPGSGAIVYRGNPAHVSRHIAGSGAIIRG